MYMRPDKMIGINRGLMATNQDMFSVSRALLKRAIVDAIYIDQDQYASQSILKSTIDVIR